MKEIEKIQLLRILRKQREEADKLTQQFSEESREFFDKVSLETNNPQGNVGLLDYVISTEYDCKHEYGIRNPEDSFFDHNCTCLDCGEYLDESEIKDIYSVDTKMQPIRQEYLELLQQMSVCDSFVTLKRKYNFRKYNK